MTSTRIAIKACLGALTTAVLAVAAAPTAGAAQTPEEPTVLHACYVPGAGVVYRVAGPDEETPELPAGCKSQDHVPFSWNEAGPEGPAGPAGPPGPAGTFQCREPGAAAGVGRSGATGPTSPGAGPRAVSVLARAATMGLDPFVGEVALVPYHFAPRGWTFAEGQLMSISQNAALFSLLGTTYGGDGQTTFALPDMRGLEPVCGMHYVIALQGIYPSRN